MTRNWTGRRKVAFWTHLIYILIPALAALVAAVRLWTFIFGEWYFAVPLILCLEGVAAVGFWFHLTKVDSPFVKARHFIPFFSVGTLGYELGAYLVGKHGWELGVPFTVFVVGVFGFLFIKSFDVLERLMIDPVQAAAEKATELTRAILIPVEEHNARAAVFREATLRLQAADQKQGQPAQPQLTLEQIKYALGDVLAAQAFLPASVASRAAEQPQATFVPTRAFPCEDDDCAVPCGECQPPRVEISDAEVEQVWNEVPYDALTKPKPLGVPCQGDTCDATLTNGQKGVAAKWANRRGLGDLILCSSCRAKHPSN